ncbi:MULTISPECIES: helix-turn-helix domain-containing protein [Actinomadura]|uniref:Helix-turn-helix domain-containing protein n=1 Tax=Actinomadura yumaensis TaxID=111807 RepID=A0ABW2CBL8_9ACTN|nr:helix-turn-helix transcriptional regulator [Actinomadura sp. J1-007]MWK33717.1 helix-turn-helix domain-containing protein [Actinomadura sp. J1-007]
MAPRKPTAQTIAFGAEVTRLRIEAGLTRLELAKRACVTRGYIAQVENGITRCRKDFAERLDKVFSSGTALADLWDDILRSAAYPKFFRDYPAAEATAVLLRAYHETFVFGLFQTKAYARTLLLDDNDFEGRMRRQAVLKSENPPTIGLVLGEAALYRQVGSPQLMREQLDYLVEVSQWENVTLQIAPTAHYRGVSGSFDLATQEDGAELLYLETSVGGHTSSDRADILHIVKAFTLLQARALSADDSRELIRKVALERWTET